VRSAKALRGTTHLVDTRTSARWCAENGFDTNAKEGGSLCAAVRGKASSFLPGGWAENTLRQSRILFLFAIRDVGTRRIRGKKKDILVQLLTCYREEPWECAIVAFVMSSKGSGN
jgi:hypothetical protein